MDESKNQNENDSNDGIAIQVKTSQPKAPLVNDITPPPAPESDAESEAVIDIATRSVEEMISADIKNLDSSEVNNESSEESTSKEPESPDKDIEVVTAPPEDSSTNETSKEAEATEVQADDNDDALSEEVPEENEAQEVPKDTIESELKNFNENKQTTVPLKQSVLTSDDKTMLSSSAPAEVGVSASQMAKHPHRNNKKLAAIVTVITALLLAGTAVYVYLSANNNTEKKSADTTNESNQNASAQPEVEPATTQDIDSTTTEVENAINALDENTDFSDADLTDSTLGL